MHVVKLSGLFQGESAGADSWPGAQDGEPSVLIPCFAERRYGVLRYGVLDNELLMAFSPRYLRNTI